MRRFLLEIHHPFDGVSYTSNEFDESTFDKIRHIITVVNGIIGQEVFSINYEASLEAFNTLTESVEEGYYILDSVLHLIKTKRFPNKKPICFSIGDLDAEILYFEEDSSFMNYLFEQDDPAWDEFISECIYDKRTFDARSLSDFYNQIGLH